MLSSTLFCLLALIARVTALAKVVKQPRGIVEYWGQNSGGSQQRLRYYCDKPSVDIVVLSFVSGFPNLELNFSNMCSNSFESGLLKCPEIGEDITYCQNKGKIILLSLGGATGSYGFQSNEQAKKFAKTMYDTFGPGNAEERPFGQAVVNGYDLDMEMGSLGYAALANELNNLHSDVEYPYFLTVAPQCEYPDASLHEVLAEAYVHAVFIQFYNNRCNLKGGNFNFLTAWKRYADTISINENVLLFIGLPGDEQSAGTGYANIDDVRHAVSGEITNYEKFGGFSLWDASTVDQNKDAFGNSFDQQLKTIFE